MMCTDHLQSECEKMKSNESIPYRRLYRFGQRYDIFRIPVNTGVPFRVYHYFLLFYSIYKVIFLITQYKELNIQSY